MTVVFTVRVTVKVMVFWLCSAPEDPNGCGSRACRCRRSCRWRHGVPTDSGSGSQREDHPFAFGPPGVIDWLCSDRDACDPVSDSQHRAASGERAAGRHRQRCSSEVSIAVPPPTQVDGDDPARVSGARDHEGDRHRGCVPTVNPAVPAVPVLFVAVVAAVEASPARSVSETEVVRIRPRAARRPPRSWRDALAKEDRVAQALAGDRDREGGEIREQPDARGRGSALPAGRCP